jgi:hypothetical protein
MSSTVLPFTSPVATIPNAAGLKNETTRNPSTIEASPPSLTPVSPKPRIDPLRTAMPNVSGPVTIPAAALLVPGPLIVKPARSIVTESAVIKRQLLARAEMVRLLTSLYEPGLSIVWHFSISVGPSSRASARTAPKARGLLPTGRTQLEKGLLVFS